MDFTQQAYSDELGRHLILVRDVQRGQCVLKQKPYAAVLYDDQVAQRCDFCFAASDTLMRCGRSKFAHYCSQAHQKAAWRAYYRKECEALVACAPNMPPASVRLAARVLWRRANDLSKSELQQQPDQQLEGGSYADIEQLQSHWDKLEGARKIMYAQMAVLTREFMQGGLSSSQPTADDQQQQYQQPTADDQQQQYQQPTADDQQQQYQQPTADDQQQQYQQPTADDQQQQYQQQQQQQQQLLPDIKSIAHLLARFACNNHTICDDELRPIGVGIYPLGALINHSCRPNCVQSFEGANIVFRSLSSIPAGQQVTISYVELAATRQERRRQLLQQYFFDIDSSTSSSSSNGSQQIEGDSAAAAARVAAAAVAGGMETLQLQCRLLPPPMPAGQQQQQQLTWRTYYSIGSSSSSSCRAVLYSYAGSSPPWPEDKVDKHLCQMLLLLPEQSASAGPSSGSSSVAAATQRLYQQQQQQQQQQQKLLKLPGGMCLFSNQLAMQAGQEKEDAAAVAAAAAAAGLFADLEGLELSAAAAAGVEEMQLAEEEDTDDESDEGGGLSVGLMGATAGGGGGSAAVQQDRHKLEQQQQHVEVVHWGDWSSAAAAAGQGSAAGSSGSSSSSSTWHDTAADLAANAAHRMLHVWALQQQAEQLAGHGFAAAAVGLYQQALAVADGSAAPQEPAAAAAAAGSTVNLPATTSAINGGGSSKSNSRIVLGPRHILRARVNAGLLKAAVDEGASWEVALAAAKAVAPVYELVYPKVWPNLGLHHAHIAKLALLLQQPAAAAHAAAAAAEILQVTHAGSSQVLQEIQRVRYEAHQELAAYERMKEG